MTITVLYILNRSLALLQCHGEICKSIIYRVDKNSNIDEEYENSATPIYAIQLQGSQPPKRYVHLAWIDMINPTLRGGSKIGPDYDLVFVFYCW